MEIARPKPKLEIPDHAKKVFTGKIFDVYQWEQEMFDGTKATFEKLKRPDTVNIIPTTKNQEIILTEQEQPGLPPFIGCLGGRVDPGEDILKAAKRELKEESGYTTETLELWYSLQPSEKIDWAIYNFIAKDIKKDSEQNLDSGEKISLLFVSFDEFIDLALAENFRDQEITQRVMRAKLSPGGMKQLRELLFDFN